MGDQDNKVVDTNISLGKFKGDKEEIALQADREWQEHLQKEEQLKQQWEMEQEKERERERQEIRRVMSDNTAGDQFNDFYDNARTTWDCTDDDQMNNIHMVTMPETQIAPAEAP